MTAQECGQPDLASQGKSHLEDRGHSRKTRNVGRGSLTQRAQATTLGKWTLPGITHLVLEGSFISPG